MLKAVQRIIKSECSNAYALSKCILCSHSHFKSKFRQHTFCALLLTSKTNSDYFLTTVWGTQSIHRVRWFGEGACYHTIIAKYAYFGLLKSETWINFTVSHTHSAAGIWEHYSWHTILYIIVMNPFFVTGNHGRTWDKPGNEEELYHQLLSCRLLTFRNRYIPEAYPVVFKVWRELEAARGDVATVSLRKWHCRSSDTIRTTESIIHVQAINPGKSMKALARKA